MGYQMALCARPRPRLGLLAVEQLEATRGVWVAEISRATVPRRCRFRIAANAAHSGASEKRRVESLAHQHCCVAVSGIGGALVVQTRGNNVAGYKKLVAARHQCRRRVLCRWRRG